jgi:glycosyltransferase involved in cell wall biosynthesis
MTPEVTHPGSRQKVLFLSFTYPSFGGSGSQIRAASLVRMLAMHADIYLLIAGYAEKVGGPPDPVMEGLCRKIAHLRVQPPPVPESVAASPRAAACRKIANSRILPNTEAGGPRPLLKKSAENVVLPTIDCASGQVAERVVEFYQESNLDCLFVFKFDALHFVYNRLDFFPVRHLDLDELPSRAQDQIARLKRNFERETLAPSKKSGRVTMQHVMEKAFIPRFHRVFVASAVEAEEVRRQTGFPRPLVLPNVYPARLTRPEKRTTPQSEILFVGSFFYYPNVDAVLYFCREILPLIQEKKRDTVLFRIIGIGSTKDLECVRKQPGVDLAGYQENLTPFYAQAAVVVVPLRAGAGTRLKILEAFVHGRPVVSTSIGAEGLEVTDRKNILLANAPDAFAQACMEVIDHPELAEKICEDATRLHRDHYSQEALACCYAKIIADELTDSSPTLAEIQ